MNSISSTKSHGYRPEIDGIRAFAVIVVIINHFNKDLLPSGYLGVDIFFVISGFVITASLASRPSKNFHDFLMSFYTRRVKRLVPALVLFVFITSILISLFNPDPGTTFKTGITSLFGLSNLYLFRLSTDYFSSSTELNAFTHTWSLGVEEQFYLLFPFLVWFTGFSRLNATKGKRNLFLLVGALSIASLISFFYNYSTNQPAAYFLMPNRLWEIGAGCLLFLSINNSVNFPYILKKIPSLIVVTAILATLFVDFKFATQTTFAIVVLTCVLLASLRPGTITYSLFINPKIVYIGLISYSLYLWHWSVLSISRWTIGIHWWSVPFQVAIILFLSIVSYRYVETPLRRSDWSDVRWKSIVYGIGTSSITALLLIFIIKIPGLSLYTGHYPSMLAVGASSLKDMYLLEQANSLWQGEKCVLSDNSEVGKEILVKDCTLGNFSKARRRVMIFGNSFSAAFTQAFDDLVLLDSYSVTITSSWGAFPVPKKELSTGGVWDESNYYYWNSVVPSLISHLKSGDWVFIISDMESFSPKSRTYQENQRFQKNLKALLESFSDKLSEKDIKLAILHGIPFAREANCQPVAAANQWFNPSGNPCRLPGRSESLSRRESLNQVLVSLELEGKLHVVDIFDVFCPHEQCTYNSKDGQFLYRDEYSHPSVEAVRLSSPIIRKVLTSNF